MSCLLTPAQLGLSPRSRWGSAPDPVLQVKCTGGSLPACSRSGTPISAKRHARHTARGARRRAAGRRARAPLAFVPGRYSTVLITCRQPPLNCRYIFSACVSNKISSIAVRRSRSRAVTVLSYAVRRMARRHKGGLHAPHVAADMLKSWLDYRRTRWEYPGMLLEAREGCGAQQRAARPLLP